MPNATEATATPRADDEVAGRARRVMSFGWWALLVFLTLGIGLESLHGWKVGFYLDVGNETRRLMWTLGHAHGALLSLLCIVFGLAAKAIWPVSTRGFRVASLLLVAATLLLPGGFLLGGAITHGGDPGLGIALLPVGALALFAAVLRTAIDASRRPSA